MDTTEFKENIKNNIDILINTIGYYGAKPTNQKYKYNCPLCNSKDNLSINNKDIKVKCFGCFSQTDVFGFVSKCEGWDNEKEFNKSLSKVAEINGLSIPNIKQTPAEKEKAIKKKKASKLLVDKKNNLEKEVRTAIKENNIEKAFEKSCEADRVDLSEYEKGLIDSITINKNGTMSANILQIGKTLLKENSYLYNDNLHYRYNDKLGIWIKSSEKEIKSLVTNELEKVCNYYSTSTTTNVARYIMDKTFNNIEGNHYNSVFNRNPYLITFKNGTFDIKKNIFNPNFDKNNYSTISIPHNYNENYKIPTKTINFISMITDSIEEINFIFEWIGYCFVSNYSIQKMLFMVGAGANGKSTLIKLINTIIGNDNYSSVTLKRIINDKYAGSSLVNKLINSVADIGADFFNDSEAFKMLTGDDTISAERKFEHSFNYTNFAKLIYSCNKLPKFKDSSMGLKRRPIILPLEKDFKSLVQNSDTHINDILNDETEIENIIAYSINKFQEVINNNYEFTESENMIQAKNDWINDNPLNDFVDEYFEITGCKNDYITLKELTELFRNYCFDRGYKPYSQKTLEENIVNTFGANGIEVKRISNKTKSKKVIGIKSLIEFKEVPYILPFAKN